MTEKGAEIKEIEPRAKILFLNVNPNSQPHTSAAQRMFGMNGSDIEDFKQMALSDIKSPSKEEGLKLKEREAKSEIYLPENVADFTAIVILGSPFTAIPRETEEGKLFVANWKHDLIKFVQSAHEKKVPILGICYGSQIVAEALGGKAQKMEKNKWEVGFSIAQRLPASYGDPVMEGLPDEFVVPQNHTDAVVRIPPGAVALAENPKYGLEAYRIGKTWGFQFHPERSGKEVEEYLSKESSITQLNKAGKNIEENKALGKGYSETVGTILSNFLRVAWDRVQ